MRAAAAVALLVMLALVVPTWWQQVRPAPGWEVAPDRIGAARAALGDLTVVGEARSRGEYDRNHFGPAWFDVDGNGCDTRNDQLAHWMTDVVYDPVQPCVVVSGTLFDPYTGNTIAFERGAQSSSAVQIDHVVALADAWSKGADTWPARKAMEFANDPANLIAVDGQTNQDKGALDAASWMPPEAGFHCAYAVQQVLIKQSYGIGVSSEELGALTEQVGACPD